MTAPTVPIFHFVFVAELVFDYDPAYSWKGAQ